MLLCGHATAASRMCTPDICGASTLLILGARVPVDGRLATGDGADR